MSEPLSPNQEAQLKTWAQQRDEALDRISKLKIEEDVLGTSVRNLSNSFSDLDKRVRKHELVISEIDQREAARVNIVSKELSDLERQKTVKEVAVTYLNKEITEKTEKKVNLVADLKLLEDTYQQTFNKVSVLDKVVDYVTKVSAENVETMNKITAAAKKIIPIEEKS